MKVSLLVPYRAEPGSLREQSWQWVEQRWRSNQPDWEVIAHKGDDDEPFSKTTAVNEAFKASSGDVLVVCDADTWMDDAEHIDRAINHALDFPVLVMPWKRSWRMYEEPTKRFLEEGPTAQFQDIKTEAYKGPHSITAAMLYVITRNAFRYVNGMDPRFRGYRFEDVSFRRACEVLLGKPRYLYGECYAFYHPRPERETIHGHARVWGEHDGGNDNRWLNHKYINARYPKQMRELVDEYKL